MSDLMVSVALKVALDAHYNKLDKQDKPYILHPLRLMMQQGIDDTEGQIVALLHDVVEDSHWTLEEIDGYFSAKVMDALGAITKREGELYDAYLERVNQNELAKRIKIADVKDNLNRLHGLITSDFDTYQRLFKKYQTAAKILDIEVEVFG